jgi:hypothetical protein
MRLILCLFLLAPCVAYGQTFGLGEPVRKVAEVRSVFGLGKRVESVPMDCSTGICIPVAARIERSVTVAAPTFRDYQTVQPVRVNQAPRQTIRRVGRWLVR